MKGRTGTYSCMAVFVLAMMVTSGFQASGALVGHWTFDNAADPAEDSSAYGNDGSLAGNASRTTDAAVGSGALVLDGTGDYCSLYTCDAFNGDFSEGEATIAVWIKLTSATPSSPKTGLGNVGNWSRPSHYPTNGSSTADVGLFLSDGSAVSVTLSGIARDEWHHLAVTVDTSDTATGYKVYQNTQLLGSYPMDGTHGNFLGPISPRIGGSYEVSTNTWYYLDGKVDDVRIYNEALDSSAIAQLVNNLDTPGDFDDDNDVDPADLAFLAEQWLSVSPQNHPVTGKSADLTGDGDVDFEDFIVFAQGWQ